MVKYVSVWLLDSWYESVKSKMRLHSKRFLARAYHIQFRYYTTSNLKRGNLIFQRRDKNHKNVRNAIFIRNFSTLPSIYFLYTLHNVLWVCYVVWNCIHTWFAIVINNFLWIHNQELLHALIDACTFRIYSLMSDWKL